MAIPSLFNDPVKVKTILRTGGGRERVCAEWTGLLWDAFRSIHHGNIEHWGIKKRVNSESQRGRCTFG